MQKPVSASSYFKTFLFYLSIIINNYIFITTLYTLHNLHTQIPFTKLYNTKIALSRNKKIFR